MRSREDDEGLTLSSDCRVSRTVHSIYSSDDGGLVCLYGGGECVCAVCHRPKNESARDR